MRLHANMHPPNKTTHSFTNDGMTQLTQQLTHQLHTTTNTLGAHAPGNPDSVRYHRMYAPTYKIPLLVRVDVTWRKDYFGRPMVSRYVYTRCSPEEYDRASQTHPDQCRPLMGTPGLGDMRSGQMLLDSAASDYTNHTLAQLMQTPAGLATVARFAQVMAFACNGVFAASNNVLHFQQQQQQRQQEQEQQQKQQLDQNSHAWRGVDAEGVEGAEHTEGNREIGC